MTSDYADYNQPQANAAAIGQVDLTATGLAKDTTTAGVNLTLSQGTNKLLDGTTAGPITDTRDHTLSTANNVAAQTSGGTIANEVASTGVPLLTKATNLIKDQNHVIPANTAVALTQVSVSQIGYEVAIKVLCAAGSTSPACTFDLVWTDSATGITVGHETWSVIGGSTSGGASYFGTGPTKADRLTVTITNQDTANTMTVTTILNQNSRIYADDDWRQEAFNSPPGFTVPSHDQQGLLLANFSGSIGAAGNAQRLIALYAGMVWVYTRNVPGAQPGQVFIRNVADKAVTASNLYERAIANTGHASLDLVALPRASCIFEIDNTGAAASTFEIAIHAACYRQ